MSIVLILVIIIITLVVGPTTTTSSYLLSTAATIRFALAAILITATLICASWKSIVLNWH